MCVMRNVLNILFCLTSIIVVGCGIFNGGPTPPDQGFKIAGQLIDTSKIPISGAEVMLLKERGGDWVEQTKSKVTTGPGGAFEISWKEVEGNYRLRISTHLHKMDYPDKYIPPHHYTPQTPGEEIDVGEIEFEESPTENYFRIKGRLIDRAKNEGIVSAAIVLLQAKDDTNWAKLPDSRARSGDKGIFRIYGRISSENKYRLRIFAHPYGKIDYPQDQPYRPSSREVITVQIELPLVEQGSEEKKEEPTLVPLSEIPKDLQEFLVTQDIRLSEKPNIEEKGEEWIIDDPEHQMIYIIRRKGVSDFTLQKASTTDPHGKPTQVNGVVF